MKTLIFSDLHLHTYERFGMSEDGILSKRLVELQGVLLQILKIAVDENVDNILFGGDWAHTDKSIAVEVLTLTKWFFTELDKLKIPFYAVRGNHDLSKKTSDNPYHYSLGIFLNKQKLPNNIYALHYDQNNIDYSTIKNFDIVICHKTPAGTKINEYLLEDGIDWKQLSANNRIVLFGHIHTPAKLSQNCEIIGSPLALTFGDVSDYGVIIIDNNIIKRIPLQSPKFITVDNGVVPENDGNYYRVTGDASFTKASNIITVKEPTYFESKIKSNTLVDILKEWLVINNKEEAYLDVIKDFLSQDLLNLKTIPNLKLKNVSLRNFMSFDNSSFDLLNGLTVISGKSETFNSNGSGKSSLCDGIFWCLFGDTTKGLTGDDVIRKYPKQQKDCLVTLLIEGEQCDYKIKRSRKDGLLIYKQDHGVDSWFNMNEGLKQKESQQLLENILGFNSTIFGSSAYFSQDQLFLLTRLGTSEKSGLITELLGFASYDKLLENVNNKFKFLETDKINTEKLLSSQTIKREFLEREKLNLVEAKKTILTRATNRKADLEVVSARKKELTEKIAAYVGKATDTSELEAEEKKLELTIVEVDKDLEALNLKQQSFQAYKEALRNTDLAINRIQLDIQQNESQSGLCGRDIVKLSKLKVGELCSFCGSIITSTHADKEIAHLEAKLIVCKEALPELKLKLEDHKKQKEELQRDITAFEKKLSETTTRKIAIQAMLRTVSSKKQRLLESKGEKDNLVTELNGVNNVLEMGNRELVQLKADYELNKTKVVDNDNSIKVNNLLINEYTLTLENLSKDIEKLTFWKEALSFKGVKSLLLDSWCNNINKILKEYISIVSDGAIFCQFSPISQTKSGEARNKLDMVIEIEGINRLYDSLSGGEKRRVDIATLLAFSAWVKDQYQLTKPLLGIQIFDEVFSYLDASGEETVAPLLRKLAKNCSIFAISHTSELSTYSDHSILVTKKNNISTLAYIK